MTSSAIPPAMGSDQTSALLARLHPELYLYNHLVHGSRPSSSTSSPLTFPQIDANLGPISSSSNRPSSIPSPSALIRYGATTVICNITSSIVYPSAAEGSTSSMSSSSTIIPSISLTPLSSPSNDFRSGAPSNYAQAVTERLFSFLDATLPFQPEVLHIPTEEEEEDADVRHGAMKSEVEREATRAKRVKAKWSLFADCVVIGFDGALLETCFLAIIAALRQVHLPKAVYSLDEKAVIASPAVEDYWSLKSKMTSFPLAFGFGIYKGTLLTTPSAFETDLCSSSLQLALSYSESSPSQEDSSSGSGSIQLASLHSTGPLSASNIPSSSSSSSSSSSFSQDTSMKSTSSSMDASKGTKVEDEDLITFCVQIASTKGREMVRLVQRREAELLAKKLEE